MDNLLYLFVCLLRELDTYSLLTVYDDQIIEVVAEFCSFDEVIDCYIDHLFSAVMNDLELVIINDRTLKIVNKEQGSTCVSDGHPWLCNCYPEPMCSKDLGDLYSYLGI